MVNFNEKKPIPKQKKTEKTFAEVKEPAIDPTIPSTSTIPILPQQWDQKIAQFRNELIRPSEIKIFPPIPRGDIIWLIHNAESAYKREVIKFKNTGVKSAVITIVDNVKAWLHELETLEKV